MAVGVTVTVACPLLYLCQAYTYMCRSSTSVFVLRAQFSATLDVFAKSLTSAVWLARVQFVHAKHARNPFGADPWCLAGGLREG